MAEKCIQDGIYQHYVDNYYKRWLQFINICTETFMTGSDEQLNKDTITSRYS